MGLDININTRIELHSPFRPGLHSFKNFYNETSPARIIQNYSGLFYLDQLTVCLGDSCFDRIKGAVKYILEICDELGTS